MYKNLRKDPITYFNSSRIVIGSSLEALIYAYFNDLPIVVMKYNPPIRIEHFSQMKDLWTLFYIRENRIKFKYYNKKEFTYGNEKRELYSKLYLILSLSGKNIFGHLNEINQIKIEGNQIDVSLTSSSTRLQFNKLIIFDDEGIVGLPKIKKSKLKEQYFVDRFIDNSFSIRDSRIVDLKTNMSRRTLFYNDGEIYSVCKFTKSSEEQDQLPIYTKFTIESLIKNMNVECDTDKIIFMDRTFVYNKINTYEPSPNINFVKKSADDLIRIKMSSNPTINSYSHHINRLLSS